MIFLEKKSLEKKPAKPERGAALVVSLIILLVMTLIGVGSLQSTTFEEKMTGNVRDKELAFEAAEMALIEGEAQLAAITTTGAFDPDGSDGFYGKEFYALWESVDWAGTDSGNANKALTASTITGTTTAPKYVIQHYATATLGKATDPNAGGYVNTSGSTVVELFRVIARGTGGSDNAVVILESTTKKTL